MPLLRKLGYLDNLVVLVQLFDALEEEDKTHAGQDQAEDDQNNLDVGLCDHRVRGVLEDKNNDNMLFETPATEYFKA